MDDKSDYVCFTTKKGYYINILKNINKIEIGNKISIKCPILFENDFLKINNNIVLNHELAYIYGLWWTSDMYFKGKLQFIGSTNNTLKILIEKIFKAKVTRKNQIYYIESELFSNTMHSITIDQIFNSPLNVRKGFIQGVRRSTLVSKISFIFYSSSIEKILNFQMILLSCGYVSNIVHNVNFYELTYENKINDFICDIIVSEEHCVKNIISIDGTIVSNKNGIVVSNKDGTIVSNKDGTIVSNKNGIVVSNKNDKNLYLKNIHIK